MNDFITRLLAQLFESFKSKNPKIAAILLMFLSLVVWFAEQGSLLGLLPLSGTWAEVVKWVGIVLGFLNGSSTVQFLDGDAQKKALAKRNLK
jgi:hypothetical protein